MSKIKVYTSYSNNTHYYDNFEVIDYNSYTENDITNPEQEQCILEKLINDTNLTSWLDNDQVIAVNEVAIDCCQGNSDVYNYNYYRVSFLDIADYHNEDDEDKLISDYITYKNYAVPKEEI